MAGIQTADPLSIQDGSPIEPFNAAKFAEAITGKTKSYQAGGNLAWCNTFWSAIPGVPISRTSARILNCYAALMWHACDIACCFC